MSKLSFILMAILAVTVMAAPSVFAANYCVISNEVGQVGVTDGNPIFGWSVVSPASCFASADAAVRDSGVGRGPIFRAYGGSPLVAPATDRRSFMAETLP